MEASVFLPVLPLRDIVVYPNMVIPLFVGRDTSARAIEDAMVTGQELFVVAQKDPKIEHPTPEDLYQVGTVVNILQLIRMQDNTVKILVEGLHRASTIEYYVLDGSLQANVERLEEEHPDEKDTRLLVRSLLKQFEQYVKANSHLPPEIVASLSSVNDLSRLVDTIIAHIHFKLIDKQAILEALSLRVRAEKLMALLSNEIDLIQMENKIRSQVKTQIDKNQREYYLNEQMKAIQKELSHTAEGESELDKMEKKIKEVGLSPDAEKKAQSELKKLKGMSPMSAEATVSRNYLEYMLNLPWKKHSKVNHKLDKAVKVLNQQHYGLDKVKERIIEYLAVQQRVNKIKGPILCLVGPPGVGKTSLALSIAEATGRKYTRFALGGVRDEAEIRGHRRTYIGSMPGKILQCLAKVGVNNPLFLLDEVDKMAQDNRGDPASALLEVLDPEQNKAFSDHYLEVDYDLSNVMFVCTANTLNIPPALLDRMEVIRIAGYTEDEKINIAQKHLMFKQMEENGLSKKEIQITDGAIQSIIRYYTREAGVRNLERDIAKICRKVVTQIFKDNVKEKIIVTAKNIEKYLGVKKFRFGLAEENNSVGEVTGLAWTEVGGELLSIEAVITSGKGRITSTGHLGEVMQESIKAALTVVRSRAVSLGIAENFYEKKDIHIHVPEGATPKDGPSAGIAMCTALVSALTGIPVRADVAMTGEITLRGEVLPIGGLKEKLLAAHRGGIKHVIIPLENERDLKEIPANVKQDIEIHPIRWIDEVLDLALAKKPKKVKTVKKKTK